MNIQNILGGKLSRRENLVFILLLILSIIFTNCYSYVHWNAPLVRNIMRVMLFLFFIWYLFNKPSTTEMHFSKDIKVLMFIPFLFLDVIIFLLIVEFLNLIYHLRKQECIYSSANALRAILSDFGTVITIFVVH